MFCPQLAMEKAGGCLVGLTSSWQQEEEEVNEEDRSSSSSSSLSHPNVKLASGTQLS